VSIAGADTVRAPNRSRGLALAISLLTIVPVRARPGDRGMGAAAAWFPLVGAGIGALAGAVLRFAPHAVAAVLATIVLVVVTGGLHQDGLADCADGLGVRGDRARRLAVMREPQLGTFGVLALVLWVALFATTLAGLPRNGALGMLVCICALGRWAALVHARVAAPARRDGLGAGFTASRPALLAATVLALGGAAALESGWGLVAAGAALATAATVSAWSRHWLGGRTGDTLGATVALAELAAALVLLAST
jgi:adenosylcobinamide-GDP ribazoletransferase